MTKIERTEASLLRYRLDKPIGGSGVAAVDVVVVELMDSDGATGLGFSYVLGGAGGEIALAAARDQLRRHALGKPVVPPQALWRHIATSFNRTGYGPNLIGLAAIDLAAWDLDARRRGLALGVAMGGAPRPVPVYGSGGFAATQSPEQAADTAAKAAAAGFRAVKPRVRGGALSDANLISAVRSALPEHVHVMIDANEKGDLASATWLLSTAREHGVLFVEEPLPALAIEGYRALARIAGVSVAAGEHLQGRSAFLPFLAERLVAVIQPDLAMCGGVTPMLDVAALAEAFDVSVSPHFLPGLFVHLAAVSPAFTWLEDFPLLEPLFEGWPERTPDGLLSPGTAPGHGLTLGASERKRFAAD
jgi:L-alanine-DL-glutamate epimerase-like enolase superfamily enzyme